MKFDIPTLMMIFFLLALILSIWKVWAFLPNKQLADDDKTEEAHKELTSLMLKVIREHHGNLDEKNLFFKITEDESFNSKLFWRFNLNRLKQLLKLYYLNNPNTNSIQDIYRILH